MPTPAHRRLTSFAASHCIHNSQPFAETTCIDETKDQRGDLLNEALPLYKNFNINIKKYD